MAREGRVDSDIVIQIDRTSPCPDGVDLAGDVHMEPLSADSESTTALVRANPMALMKSHGSDDLEMSNGYARRDTKDSRMYSLSSTLPVSLSSTLPVSLPGDTQTTSLGKRRGRNSSQVDLSMPIESLKSGLNVRTEWQRRTAPSATDDGDELRVFKNKVGSCWWLDVLHARPLKSAGDVLLGKL